MIGRGGRLTCTADERKPFSIGEPGKETEMEATVLDIRSGG